MTFEYVLFCGIFIMSAVISALRICLFGGMTAIFHLSTQQLKPHYRASVEEMEFAVHIHSSGEI